METLYSLERRKHHCISRLWTGAREVVEQSYRIRTTLRVSVLQFEGTPAWSIRCSTARIRACCPSGAVNKQGATMSRREREPTDWLAVVVLALFVAFFAGW